VSGAPVVAVDPLRPQPAAIRRAAELVRAGGLVAFPTETVYGLGANALDDAAVQRIFAAKQRPGYNPLIVHVPDVAAARRVVATWPEAAERLAAAFWPGPLTIVLPKAAVVPDSVTAGLSTVAVRVPAHAVALALLAAAGLPIAAPSANRFMRLSPTSAAHVERALGDHADLILDGGDTPVGIESTVLDLSGPRPVLLRPGVIGEAELRTVIGELVRGGGPAAGEARPSPGMMDRHYAPVAELRLYSDATEAGRRIAEARARGRTVGVLPLDPLGGDADHVIPMPASAREYARLLYAALHSLDDAGCDLILVQRVPPLPEWHGVDDRLRRAGG
jgi:L-threonylcarbamoyladenylate synthase